MQQNIQQLLSNNEELSVFLQSSFIQGKILNDIYMLQNNINVTSPKQITADTYVKLSKA